MPLKRSESLQPLSRDHHHGLLLCWKIRTGIKSNISTDRIKKYVDWFYKNHLIPHFELEEHYIFPILAHGHEMTKKAISDHRRLKRLFEATQDVPKHLNLIEEELEQHIRFEERILFPEIEKVATPDELLQVKHIHTHEKFVDEVSDPFWKKETQK